MKINEIFKSIQGESTYAGTPCTFIRTAHCNLRCRWCDTAYAFHDGEERTLDSILDEVRRLGCQCVELTGGEPLLQEEIYPLMTTLVELNYQVLIETSGSLPIDRVDPRVTIVMDVKCPESGMDQMTCWENLQWLKPRDEVKFVIANRNDFEWAESVLSAHASLKGKAILFSPVFGEMDPSLLAEWILADNLPVRIQLQLHKYIWDPSLRGV